MSIPTDDDLYALVDDIQTEAAIALALDPMAETSGPPAQWSGSGVESSGDATLDHFKGRFSYVTGVFERFMKPDYTKYEYVEHAMFDGDFGLFNQFNVSTEGLSRYNRKIDNLERAINDSSGDAFDNFSDWYLDKFDTIWGNHAKMTMALGGAAKGLYQSRAQARVDLKIIGDKTVGALKDLGSDGASASEILGVVSLAAGALAFIPPLSVPAGVISVGTGVGSYIAPGDEAPEAAVDSKWEVTGSDAISIVASMCEAVNTLEEDVRTAENKIAKALATINRQAESQQFRRDVTIAHVDFPGRFDV